MSKPWVVYVPIKDSELLANRDEPCIQSEIDYSINTYFCILV
jgi:hypothetical protein